jgi:molybdopterin/thiamine biosynthesis adenylyltransferase
MSEKDWRKHRDSRSLRYEGRVLNPDRRIVLSADHSYIRRYDGQVAVLVAANILGRMSPSVSIDLPEVEIVDPLPWKGANLVDHLLKSLRDADPYGSFNDSSKAGEYNVHFGRSGALSHYHGSGWNAYCGSEESPLVDDDSYNPIGPAFAAIIAAAAAFESDLNAAPNPVLMNALTWEPGMAKSEPELGVDLRHLGKILSVGTGSVGSAILYFLGLANTTFQVDLVDMDDVGIHNLDRSPIFINRHVGMKKVDATAEFLRGCGISEIASHPVPLDEARVWRKREAGYPDMLITAANERGVRSIVENNYPPLQIYGTTGQNWQTAMIRHVPMKDPCSLCIFPEQEFKDTICSAETIEGKTGEPEMDAALPFSAGVMAAAEILKVGLDGFPFTTNRVVLNARQPVRAVPAALKQEVFCTCNSRSKSVHRQTIDGSAYSSL